MQERTPAKIQHLLGEIEYEYVDENLGARNAGRKLFTITTPVLKQLTETYPDIRKDLLYHYKVYDGMSNSFLGTDLIYFPFRNDS